MESVKYRGHCHYLFMANVKKKQGVGGEERKRLTAPAPTLSKPVVAISGSGSGTGSGMRLVMNDNGTNYRIMTPGVGVARVS